MKGLIRSLALALLITGVSLPALAETIDINSADAGAMAEALQGVGPRRAEAIVAWRRQHGPFKTPDDLLKVPGIGKRTLQRNRNRIATRSAD